MRILLAAPTGRASKRMSEATAMEAKTIHRLLEFNPQDGYKRNEENPLEGDALIVDECSMIDIILMYNLMKAIPEHMRWCWWATLTSCRVWERKRSTRYHRLRENSGHPTHPHLPTGAVEPNHHECPRHQPGIYPDTSNGKQTDFFFIKNEDPEQVATEIVNLVKYRLPKAYNQPQSNIQVLTPMQRSV